MVVLKTAVAAGVIVLLFRERSLIASSIGATTYVKWIWLVLAVGLEVVSMGSFAGIQARLLRAGPTRVSLLPVMKTVFAGNALSASIPIAGSQLSLAFVFRRLKQLGVEAAVAAWVLVLAGVISSLASALLLVAGAILSGNDIAAAAGSVGGVLGAAVFALAVMAIRRDVVLSALLRPAGWVLLKVSNVRGRPVDDPDAVLRDAACRMASLRLPLAGWTTVGAAALLNWLADVGVLAASIASVGAHVPWRGLLLAYGIGIAAATFEATPGGLGVVEAALALALMSAGVPHPSALAAVLVYRLISFWMVTSVGWVVYLRSGRDVRRARVDAAHLRQPVGSHGSGGVDLDVAGAVSKLEPVQPTRPVRQPREQNVA